MTPGTAFGLGTQTSPSSPSGSMKKRLRIAPKSVTKPSVEPFAMSRSRMVSNASIEAASSPMWSMRPLDGVPDGRVEHLSIERVQPSGVAREDRHVVDPVQQHHALLSSARPALPMRSRKLSE